MKPLVPARLVVLLSLLVALLAVGGCGDLPQPFAHDGRAPGLARLPTAAGVVVVPPQNAPPPFAEAAAAGLAAALRAADTPAQAAPEAVAVDTGGYVVRGILSPDATTLAWDLRSPEGATLLLHRQDVPPNPDADALGAAAGAPLKAALDRDLDAPLVLRMATADDPTGHRAPPSARAAPTQVAVLAVGGLPPDRSRLLAAALTGALQARGVAVTEDAAFSVAGHVTLDAVPGSSDTHALRVVWAVLHADGTEAGSAEQANSVPAPFWTEHFPTLATAIADAAAGGVISILDQATPSQPAR